MSTAVRSNDPGEQALEEIGRVLELYKDPKNPDSVRQISTIAALFRASQNASNALSWGEAMGPGVRLKFFLFCARQGFDPTSNHVYILGGRPYVSIEGRMFKADQHRDDKGEKTFNGFAYDRVMTKAEREDYDVPEGAIGWICAVERADCKYPFVGVAFAGGPLETNPVAKGKDRLAMAKKRANEKALRLAYPLDASADEGDLAEPVTRQAEVVSIQTTPGTGPLGGAGEAATAAPTNGSATSDDLKAEQARYKELEARGKPLAVAVRCEHGLRTAVEMKTADAAAWRAVNDDLAQRIDDPRGPELRQKAARLRVEQGDLFKAKLDAARASQPGFDPEFARCDDLAAFLDDVMAAAAAAGAS